MFCTNCGRELPDYARFCDCCGAPQDDETGNISQQPQPCTQQPSQPCAPPQPAAYTTHKKKNWKGVGTIMLIFGLLSVYGCSIDGNYAQMAARGIDLANIVTLLLQALCIIGGIRLIFASKES